ncbi:hypothetical protein AAFF_G00258650 [Aldrovandia affinis]|uniref:Uncharacterized protein n=1 Tax=Aldrovandia affinis TaxID=143900 RepID=A0AAD7STH7_9TELE|nr:hypothetical protein AAFF_G00258650 [Aldrovandia affinis]
MHTETPKSPSHLLKLWLFKKGRATCPPWALSGPASPPSPDCGRLSARLETPAPLSGGGPQRDSGSAAHKASCSTGPFSLRGCRPALTAA